MPDMSSLVPRHGLLWDATGRSVKGHLCAIHSVMLGQKPNLRGLAIGSLQGFG